MDVVCCTRWKNVLVARLLEPTDDLLNMNFLNQTTCSLYVNSSVASFFLSGVSCWQSGRCSDDGAPSISELTLIMKLTMMAVNNTARLQVRCKRSLGHWMNMTN